MPSTGLIAAGRVRLLWDVGTLTHGSILLGRVFRGIGAERPRQEQENTMADVYTVHGILRVREKCTFSPKDGDRHGRASFSKHFYQECRHLHHGGIVLEDHNN